MTDTPPRFGKSTHEAAYGYLAERWPQVLAAGGIWPRSYLTLASLRVDIRTPEDAYRWSVDQCVDLLNEAGIELPTTKGEQ